MIKQKIFKLPDPVINQIAAGEVVESPASIVKELIENSLDAGAKTISVEIVSGGQQLIRIEDDGCGMGPDDALLSLERHATSKIRSVEDLETLATMGFRGEALAAISSVSQFELKTSDGTGTRILAEGGKVTLVEPCARNQGTTIEVRSLFFNTPARKKFQKSPSSNAAQVSKVIETMALAHPEVTFVFNGREFRSSTQKERIAEILGEHEHEISGPGLSGFVAAPSKAGLNRLGQYVYINRRPIFSPLISKAVKQGFGTRIGENLHPRFVLFLELSPELVDVNVHPQKKEVRFSDEGKVFRWVQKAVEGAFVSPVVFEETLTFTQPPISFTMPPIQESFESIESKLDFVFHDRVLTILGNYLLIEKEALIVVDIKALHARVLFEQLKQEKGAAQALIWPLEFPIEPGEEGLEEALGEVGIECRVLKNQLVVDALPSCLEAAHFPTFLSHWREGKKIEQITTRFCRGIKKQTSIHEATALWQQLQKCQDRLYDPLGNLIWKEIKEDQLWTLFVSKD